MGPFSQFLDTKKNRATFLSGNLKPKFSSSNTRCQPLISHDFAPCDLPNNADDRWAETNSCGSYLFSDHDKHGHTPASFAPTALSLGSLCDRHNGHARKKTFRQLCTICRTLSANAGLFDVVFVCHCLMLFVFQYNQATCTCNSNTRVLNT